LKGIEGQCLLIQVTFMLLGEVDKREWSEDENRGGKDEVERVKMDM
jgi:hypothetical protein